MKIMNKFTAFLSVFLVISLLLSTSALALEVTSKAPSAIEGENYEYTITLKDQSKLKDLKFSLTGNPQVTQYGEGVDSKTGKFSISSFTNVNFGSKQKANISFSVDIEGKENGKTNKTTHKFTVPITRALDIKEVKVGKAGSSLNVVKQNEATQNFKPGDKVTFAFTLSNRNTQQSVINGKVTASTSQSVLTAFPATPLNTIQIKPAQEKSGSEVTFDYTIPTSTGSGTEKITFNFGAEDISNSNLLYKAAPVVVNLPVKRLSNQVAVSDIKFTDKSLTCNEKQNTGTNVSFDAVNTGAQKQKVTIEVIGPNNKVLALKENVEIENNGQKKTYTTALNKTMLTQYVGDVNVQVLVYKQGGKDLARYATQTIKLEVEDCKLSLANIPKIQLKEDETLRFNVTKYIQNVEVAQTLSLSTTNLDKIANVRLERDSKTNDRFFVITPKANAVGSGSFVAAFSEDGKTASATQKIEVDIAKKNDDPVVVKANSPSNTGALQYVRTTKEFNVTVSNPDAKVLTVEWKVNGITQVASSKKDKDGNDVYFLTFGNGRAVGSYKISVTVKEGTKTLTTKEWNNVQVISGPADLKTAFPGTSTSTIPQGANQQALRGFTLENANGKVVFDVVDLSKVEKIANVVKINKNTVAVKDITTSGATITLTNPGVTNPVILRSSGFDSGTFTLQPGITVNKVGNQVSFRVNSFSTYQVAEKQPAKVEIESVTVTTNEKGKTYTQKIKVKNTGSETAQSVTLKANFDSKYKASLSTTSLGSLGGTQEQEVTLTFFVPEDENGGTSTIGSVSVTYSDGTKQATATSSVKITTKSVLEIDDFEVNGKSSGDLDPSDESNTIEFTIKNTGDKDIEDVEVEVEILDVDGDDLEESEDIDEIKDDDDEDVKVTFDLSREDLDEESYKIKITVTGEVDGEGDEELVFEKTVDVERENNKVIFRDVDLRPTIVRCTSSATVDVEVENVGKKDQDDVEIRVISSALGVNLKRTNIDLEDYSDSDNDYRTSFNINVANVNPGNYPITVELYNDGDLEETENLNLEVLSCSGSSSNGALNGGSSNVNSLAQDLRDQLERELNNARAGQQVVNQPASSQVTSFRESNTYLFLLALLTALVLVAVLLAVVGLGGSKRRKKRRYHRY